MITLLIIYLLGCIITFIFLYKTTLNKWEEITISDIGVFLIMSLFSWLGLAVGLLVFYGEDKVIIRKKSKKHDTTR